MKISTVRSNKIVNKLANQLYWELTFLANDKFSSPTFSFLFARKIKHNCSDSSEFEHHCSKGKMTRILLLFFGMFSLTHNYDPLCDFEKKILIWSKNKYVYSSLSIAWNCQSLAITSYLTQFIILNGNKTNLFWSCQFPIQ
jgi:hypothetical protein